MRSVKKFFFCCNNLYERGNNHKHGAGLHTDVSSLIELIPTLIL